MSKKYLLEDEIVAAARTHNQRVRFLEEEIKDLFQIRLVQCPECSTIISIPTDLPFDKVTRCSHCDTVDDESMFPDFFY